MKHAVAAIVALSLAACQGGSTAGLPTGQNAQVIRGMYNSFAEGDITAVADAMAPDVEWNEAENLMYADGNPYVGPSAVVEGVFSRVGADWAGFTVHVKEIIESGDRVVALGRFTGRNNDTGSPIDAQFAHVWRLEDGKVVSFQQYTDTFQFAAAAAAGGKAKARPAVSKHAGKGQPKAAPATKAHKAPTKKKPARKSKTGR